MSYASFALLFVFICVTELTNGALIKATSFESEKDVPKDVVGNKLNLDPEYPAPEVTLNNKCAYVGEFCMNHKDCCSNSCLGYLKRCVS